ncbi:hypothetical protein OROMI_030000 [Orobanche minor]
MLIVQIGNRAFDISSLWQRELGNICEYCEPRPMLEGTNG